MAKRNLYLKTTPVSESLERYLEALGDSGSLIPKKELVSAYEALNRVTAKPIFAKCCSPLFNASAMDGICVSSVKTKGASENNPLRLKLGIDYKIVDTGDPIKSPYDAVIMAEDVLEIDDETVEITESVPGWQHVRPLGEDIVVGEMLLPTNHKIRPVDIGVLLAGGNLEVEVYKRPEVGIIPTGTEIIKPCDLPKEGDIIDSNSGMFEAMVSDLGGVPKRYDIVEDNYEKIKNTILKALDEQDMVIVNAGSSAGTEDFTVHILREIGEVIIHGVAMKPGKPVIFAIVNGKPVIGLPGYPVSAYLAFETFVKPVLKLMEGGRVKEENEVIKAVISTRLVSSLKHREYVRVKVGKVGDKYIAAPLSRGAGAAMSLVKSDGFLIIPQNSEGYEAGETVDVILYKDKKQVENTLVSIGSHDMLMDIIADMMSYTYPGLNLSSSHVGSMGGLMALKRNEATITPTHLLDEETGEYNVSYLKEIFPDEEMCLIKGVERVQGIMVKKGNPLNITGVKDLVNVRYVNRQRGAGTRVLLDYLLKKEKINPRDISGYEKEAQTHMAVAALVSSDEIDCGMGIQPAADALGLDFVFVGVEEYDFAIHKEDLDKEEVKAFLSILTSDEFKEKLEKIGGYGFKNTGKIIEIV